MATETDGVNMKLFGIKELDELFEKLKTSQQRSVLISAFRKATRPLVVDIKNNLKSRTKTKASSSLYKSIGVKPDRYLPILKIGARRGRGYGGYHAHLLESGTVVRSYTHKKSGKVHETGKVTGTNFFSDAVKSDEREVIDSIQKDLILSMSKFIIKANHKAKSQYNGK